MKLYQLAVFSGLFIVACSPEVTKWTPSESPKKNIVNRAVFSHTVHYPAHSESMDNQEKRALHQFLKRYIIRPSSVTVVLEEYGGHSDKRIKDIERELVLFGIPYHFLKVESSQEQDRTEQRKESRKGKSASGVELIFERFVVIPPSCSDFSQPIGDAEQAYNHSNFGCSDTANLGMMVANARDLVDGRKVDVSDGTVLAAGIERYRTDKVKSLVESSTTESPDQSSSNTGQSASGGGAAGAY